MEIIAKIGAWWMENSGMIAAVFMALYALCEALAMNPKVQANSVYQAIRNGIKSILSFVFKKQV